MQVSTSSFGAGGNDVWLVKTNENGDSLWSRTFGGTGNEVCQHILQASDGGYILAGYTNSFGNGGYDGWLLRTNANGDSIWSRVCGGSSDDIFNFVQQSSDGSYSLCGETESFGSGSIDFWLVKTETLCGPLSGTLGPGEFHVDCDISVEVGDTLDILPGTQIVFNGHYKLDVFGLLRAIGTEQDSIVFTCDLQTNPERWRGIRFANAHLSCNMEYCVIEHGKATGAWPHNCGGGISCDSSSSPSLSHCVIRENSAGNDGGGIYCRGYSSPSFTNCTIISNDATDAGGAAFCRDDCYLNFTNCLFQNNTANQEGGGVSIGITCSLTAIGCTFTGNLAQTNGGAMYGGTSLTLTNCTISGNLANNNGGGISGSETSAITNTIIWGNCADNVGDEVYLVASTSITFECCDVDSAGIYEGSGTVTWLTDNIFIDPEFCGRDTCTNAPTTAGDYTINECSPCAATQQPECGLIGALDVGCEPYPAPVGDLIIDPQGANVVIAWSSVDTSICGTPIEVDYYLVYYSDYADGPFFYHGYTADTSYTHLGAVQFAAAMNYEVTAYVGSIGILKGALDELGPNPRREVLLNHLRKSVFVVK